MLHLLGNTQLGQNVQQLYSIVYRYPPAPIPSESAPVLICTWCICFRSGGHSGDPDGERHGRKDHQRRQGTVSLLKIPPLFNDCLPRFFGPNRLEIVIGSFRPYCDKM